jgi:hypothetical protein
MAFEKDNFEEENELAPLEEDDLGAEGEEVVEEEILITADDGEDEAPSSGGKGSRGSAAKSSRSASARKAARKPAKKKARKAPKKAKKSAKKSRKPAKKSGKKKSGGRKRR